MDWLVYLACFAAGAFFVNGVPHFVAGVSGRKFHSPFARPPVWGESSALVNAIWGLANLFIGFQLLCLPCVSDLELNPKVLFFSLGAFIMTWALAVVFSRIDKKG